jgi:hypothetical protein
VQRYATQYNGEIAPHRDNANRPTRTQGKANSKRITNEQNQGAAGKKSVTKPRRQKAKSKTQKEKKKKEKRKKKKRTD